MGNQLCCSRLCRGSKSDWSGSRRGNSNRCSSRHLFTVYHSGMGLQDVKRFSLHYNRQNQSNEQQVDALRATKGNCAERRMARVSDDQKQTNYHTCDGGTLFTHARTRTRSHARTHTHARTRTHAHAHTHTHARRTHDARRTFYPQVVKVPTVDPPSCCKHGRGSFQHNVRRARRRQS